MPDCATPRPESGSQQSRNQGDHRRAAQPPHGGREPVPAILQTRRRPSANSSQLHTCEICGLATDLKQPDPPPDVSASGDCLDDGPTCDGVYPCAFSSTP